MAFDNYGKRFEKYEKDLKPCPLCGCDKPIIEQYPGGGFAVTCPRWACPREYMYIFPTIEQAVKAWNKAIRSI